MVKTLRENQNPAPEDFILTSPNKSMPIVDPRDLVGRTFLMDKEESQVQVVIFMKETGETEDFTEMQNLSKTHIPTEFQTTFLKANGKMEWNVE